MKASELLYRMIIQITEIKLNIKWTLQWKFGLIGIYIYIEDPNGNRCVLGQHEIIIPIRENRK